MSGLRRRGGATVLVAGFVLAACSGDDGDGGAPTTTAESAAPEGSTTAEPEGSTTAEGEESTAAEPDGPSAVELCADAALVEAGAVASPEPVEISGVAMSRRHQDVLWVHNDSGHPAELFAVGADGSDRGAFAVPAAESIDWEDIAAGRGPEQGVDYLYVGDIGDNVRVLFDIDLRADSPVTIYRLPEPDLGDEAETAAPVAFRFEYEDDFRDAETLMADPLTDDLFVVSKQFDGTAAGVYRLPADMALAEDAPDDVLTLERVGDVAGTADVLVTGGDISANGTLIVLRTDADVLLWDRDPEATVATTLATPAACTIPVEEPQGEAVAFAEDARGFVTISEGDHPPLLRHELP